MLLFLRPVKPNTENVLTMFEPVYVLLSHLQTANFQQRTWLFYCKYIQKKGENDVLKKVSVNNGRGYNLPVSKIMAQSPIATPPPPFVKTTQDKDYFQVSLQQK